MIPEPDQEILAEDLVDLEESLEAAAAIIRPDL
jgi:hypothetical protein